MAKQTSNAPAPAQESVTVYRVRPHIGKDGLPVPEKWDCEEITVTGVVTSRKVHERAQTLPVAREKWHVLTYRRHDRGEPETW